MKVSSSIRSLRLAGDQPLRHPCARTIIYEMHV